MRDGRYVVDEKHGGVRRFPIGGGAEPAAGSAGSLEAALRGAASRAAARRKAGGYVLGESCCVIDLGEVAHSTRFVQIRLKRPAEGATSFALRNVYVLGPRAADAGGREVPSDEADEAAMASLAWVSETVNGRPPPPPPPEPRGPSSMYYAIERRKALNQQSAARVVSPGIKSSLYPGTSMLL